MYPIPHQDVQLHRLLMQTWWTARWCWRRTRCASTRHGARPCSWTSAATRSSSTALPWPLVPLQPSSGRCWDCLAQQRSHTRMQQVLTVQQLQRLPRAAAQPVYRGRRHLVLQTAQLVVRAPVPQQRQSQSRLRRVQLAAVQITGRQFRTSTGCGVLRRQTGEPYKTQHAASPH